MSQYLTALKEEKSKDLKEGEKAFINELTNFLRIDISEEQLISDREIEVLKEMSTGASNKEIGENLCISVSTVKTHIINIYSKLQVNSRIEAVDLARKMKLITENLKCFPKYFS